MSDEQHSDTENSEEQPALAGMRDVETVYQPAEDSKLLADGVIEYRSTDGWDGTLGLDVGTGSGYLAHRISEQLGIEMVGCDINPNACAQARDAGVPVVRSDMFAPFRDSVFDLVVCNPPYLPTPPDEEWGDWMEHALSGGPDGRAVVDPFIENVGRVLTENGDAFLLISTLTGQEDVEEFAAEHGLDSEIVSEESHPFEKLLVLHLYRGS